MSMSFESLVADSTNPISLLSYNPLRLPSDAPPVLELEWHPTQPMLVTGNVEGKMELFKMYEPIARRKKMKYAQKKQKDQLDSMKLLTTFTHHTESCRSLLFHPNGSHLYTGSLDKSIAIVDMSTSQLFSQKKDAHEFGINKLAFYNDFMLVSGDENGYVNIWDLRSNQPTNKFNASAPAESAYTKPKLNHLLHYQDGGDYISDILPIPDKSRLILTSGDGHMYVYDMRAGHIHELLSGKAAAKNAKIQPKKGVKKSPSGSRHAMGGVIDTWFAMSDDVEDELSGLVSLKNGRKIVVAGREEGVLNIFKYDYWGLAQDHFNLSVEMDDKGMASVDCMLKVDEDTVITGGTDGLIRLVQVHPNKVLSIIGTHEDFPIECLKMSPPQADYFDSAIKREVNDDDDDDDDDSSTGEHVTAGDEDEDEPVANLIPRFLASSSHDQTIKFWNCSELYEVDPDEVKQEEEDSDEDDEDGGDSDDSGHDSDDDKPRSKQPLNKLAGKKLAPVDSKPAASNLKRKRDEPQSEDESKADGESSDGEFDEDGMSDISDSSQLEGGVTLGLEGEDGEDDEYDSDDIVIDENIPFASSDEDGESGEDGEGDEDGEDDMSESDDAIAHKVDKAAYRDKLLGAPKVSSAWEAFVNKGTKAEPTPSPVPTFLQSANPFAMPTTNPFAMPATNPFAVPMTNPFAMPTTTTTTTTSASTTSASSTAATTNTTTSAAATASAPSVSKPTNRWLKIAPSASSASTAGTTSAPQSSPAATATAASSSPPSTSPPTLHKLASKLAPVPSAKPLPGSRLAPAGGQPSKPALGLRLAPSPPLNKDSDSDDEPARKKSKKADLNADTKFFAHLAPNHPMHPSQAHKRVGKQLKVEEDNIAKRGDKKRAQLQELLAKRKAKKERTEAKRAEAVAKGEDPDLLSESEEEEPVKGQKGKKGMKAKQLNSDDSDGDSDDDSDADGPKSKAPKERKLTSKERKALAKAEKRKNPFFSGL